MVCSSAGAQNGQGGPAKEVGNCSHLLESLVIASGIEALWSTPCSTTPSHIVSLRTSAPAVPLLPTDQSELKGMKTGSATVSYIFVNRKSYVWLRDEQLLQPDTC